MKKLQARQESRTPQSNSTFGRPDLPGQRWFGNGTDSRNRHHLPALWWVVPIASRHVASPANADRRLQRLLPAHCPNNLLPARWDPKRVRNRGIMSRTAPLVCNVIPSRADGEGPRNEALRLPKWKTFHHPNCVEMSSWTGGNDWQLRGPSPSVLLGMTDGRRDAVYSAFESMIESASIDSASSSAAWRSRRTRCFAASAGRWRTILPFRRGVGLYPDCSSA